MNPSEPDPHYTWSELAVRAQGQDCLESEQVLTHPSLEVCSYELPTLKAGMEGQTVRLWAGGMVMLERGQGRGQGKVQVKVQGKI